MAAAFSLTNFHSTPSINSSLSPYQKTSVPTRCLGLYRCYKYPGGIGSPLVQGPGELGKSAHKRDEGSRSEGAKIAASPSLAPHHPRPQADNASHVGLEIPTVFPGIRQRQKNVSDSWSLGLQHTVCCKDPAHHSGAMMRLETHSEPAPCPHAPNSSRAVAGWEVIRL